MDNKITDVNSYTLLAGDCLEKLKELPDNCVDSIVTDPPYGLSFMGKRWDYDVPSVNVWAECLRVLKPGGHLLAFAGTRTQHRMAVRIEDAGFEIRDMIAWVYGSGFPKSHNGEWGGTALKPALEPITMARKPLSGTVAANWAEHGTAALNIEGCRVPAESMPPNTGSGGLPRRHDNEIRGPGVVSQPHENGRWPANLIHDGSDEVLSAFPQAKGQQGAVTGNEPSSKTNQVYGQFNGRQPTPPRGDAGSAARFFYCAKASKKDRGIDNSHPTVKPTELMQYLCRLVTPPGGIVLDPFMGSGSTGKAALLEGLDFIGCELSEEYLAIAEARMSSVLEVKRG